MNDNRTELNHLLERLHYQIEHAQSLDEDQVKQLSHLEKDIQDLLARSPAKAGGTPPDVIDQLENAVTSFEMSHPALAATFTKLMEILSNAGI